MPTAFPSYDAPKGPSGWIAQLKLYIDEQIVIGAGGGLAVTNVIPAATYTLVATDVNKILEFTNAGAVTLTVPNNASVPFAVGTVIELFQYGAGQVTVVAAGGGGAFPGTSVLDNANRADGAIGANWTTPVGGLNTLVIASNHFGSASGGYPVGLWNTSYAADQEAFLTVGASISDDYWLILRSDSTDANSYIVDFYGGTGEISKRVASVQTSLSTFTTTTLVAGDVIGARIVGNTITCYRNGTLVKTFVDSTFAGAGQIGFGQHNSVGYADDFGGGNVPAAVSIRSPGGRLKLASQYAMAALRYRGSDEWSFEGDIST